MPTPAPTLWLLTCALALCSCATTGAALQCPEPPKLPPLDPLLMQAPTTEQQVRAELLQPPPPAMHRSAASKPY